MNTEKFSNKADNYAKGRPDYPVAVVDFIKTLIDEQPIIADIGAGTGKFTKLIADLGYQVFAVEPNQDMFNQLQITVADVPNAKTVLATSEATTLADQSIDIITVAQALHWFDLEKFKVECQRILKPNGWVVAMYNNGVDARNNQAQHRIDATKDFFVQPVIKEFRTPITYNREKWLASAMSRSYSPLPDDENYDEFMQQAIKTFELEAVHGLMHREIVTTVYAERVVDILDEGIK